MSTNMMQSSSSSNLFAFEVLDFGGNRAENAANQQKQLACVRCHAQKLGCVRYERNGTCERCHATSAKCVVRRPQRMGRPRPGTSQQTSRPDISPTAASPNSFENAKANGTSTPKSNSTTRSPSSPHTPISTIPSSWSIGDTSSLQNRTFFDGMDIGGPSAGWAGLNAPELLPNFSDVFPEALNLPVEWSQSTQSTPSEMSSNLLGSIDLTEQLTNLNLEIHKCLNTMHSIEAEATADIRLSINQAFQNSEQFVKILKELGGTEKDRPSLSLTPHNQSSYTFSNDFNEHGTTLMDSATELMAMSCYIRILCVFEIIACSLSIPSPQTMNSIMEGEIHIGQFSPKPDRALKVRLLLQIILHMLDSMCDSVKITFATESALEQTMGSVKDREMRLRKKLVVILQKSFFR